MKPILFNTQMVRAILDGRKTMTRRVIKTKHDNTHLEMFTNKYGTRLVEKANESNGGLFATKEKKAPYRVGDILYVRETWKTSTIDPAGGGYALQDIYLYKADEPIDTTGMMVEGRWHPSIHMPWVAARIFLRVKDVRVERLQDIDEEQAKAEGANFHVGIEDKFRRSAIDRFAEIWESTIKPAYREKYGWAANPWAWVISFERISWEEAIKGAKQ